MITKIRNIPKNIVGFEVSGMVTAGDYEKTVFPAIEKNLKTNKEIRALLHMGKKFKGMKFGAMVDDLKVGLKYFRHWKKIAVVTDKRWLTNFISMFRFMWPGQVKTYHDRELKLAVAWLKVK